MIPRQVVLVGGHGYRPAPYRPPSLGLSEQRPALGQSVAGLNFGDIGQSILTASLGAGALYGAQILPDPIKTIAMISGIGLLGYSAYTLFGSGSKASGPGVQKGVTTPITPTQAFNAVSAKFQKAPGAPGGLTGFNTFSDTYPIDVLISNPNERDVDVTFNLLAEETPHLLYFIPLPSSRYVADSQTITLKPGNKTFTFHPKVNMSRWFSGSYDITLVLTKIRVSNEAMVILDSVTLNVGGFTPLGPGIF